MHALRIAYDWVERHAFWLLLLVVGAWTGAKLVRRKDNAITTVGDAIRAQSVAERVRALQQQSHELSDHLRSEKKALEAADVQKANQILRISAEIERQKKTLAELHSGKPWESLSDAEVQAALRDAGL